MSGPALKACPFCGGGAAHIERSNPLSKWKHSVDCTSSYCGMSGPVEATKAKAIAAWNDRPIERELLEALEDCLNDLWHDMHSGMDRPEFERQYAGAFAALAKAKGEA